MHFVKDGTANPGTLILLNASPVGDHVMLLDLADRFYRSAGIPTRMFIKHNFAFLRDLSKGYPFVECVDWNTASGKIRFVATFFSSMFRKAYLVFVLPIPHKAYLRAVAGAFQYLTRTEVVSLSYEGMEGYLPAGIHIPASIHDKFFYEQGNEILEKLGFKAVPEPPHFRFLKDESVKKRYGLHEGYVVVHPAPSHEDRRIPEEKWQAVFSSALKEKRQIVFTGAGKDKTYIAALAENLPKDSFAVVLDAPAQDLVNIFYFAEELFMVHTGPTHIVAGLHKKMKVFAHLWLKQFDMSYDENADIEILSEVKDVISMQAGHGVTLRGRFANYQLAIGKLGDFFVHLDLAKKLSETDGSRSVIFLMGNEKFLKGAEGALPFVRVEKISFSGLCRSLFDYAFRGGNFIWPEAVDLSKFRRKGLALALNAYVFLAWLLTFGRRVFVYNYPGVFPWVSPARRVDYEKGKRMWLEANAELYRTITGKSWKGGDSLPLTVSGDFKKKYSPDRPYLAFTLTAGDEFRTLSPETWNGFFRLLEKDPAARKINLVILGAASEGAFIGACLEGIGAGNIVRADGKLDFLETADCLASASGFLTLRTGTTTFATLLPGVSMPILVIRYGRQRTWDYDYYPNISLLFSPHCRCEEDDSSACFKTYPDGIRRARCIGDVSAGDIYEAVRAHILSKLP